MKKTVLKLKSMLIDFEKKILARFSESGRLVVFVVGIAIIAVSFIFAGFVIHEKINARQSVESSLEEAKQSLSVLASPSETAPAAPPQVSDDEVSEPVASASPSPEPTLDIVKKSTGEIIGYMTFDSIVDKGKPREVPIIEGTDDKLLDKGAGLHELFSYPGEKGNCLIFGHRTSVFKNFDKLNINDRIKITTYYGVFVYKIIDMQVVEPMDPIMFKIYDEPVLTLVTCYPFVYVGHAPDRYVVIGTLESQKELIPDINESS